MMPLSLTSDATSILKHRIPGGPTGPVSPGGPEGPGAPESPGGPGGPAGGSGSGISWTPSFFMAALFKSRRGISAMGRSCRRGQAASLSIRGQAVHVGGLAQSWCLTSSSQDWWLVRSIMTVPLADGARPATKSLVRSVINSLNPWGDMEAVHTWCLLKPGGIFGGCAVQGYKLLRGCLRGMRTGFTSYNDARYFANKELLAVVSPTKYAHPAVPTNIIKKMWSATAALFNVSPAPNSPPLLKSGPSACCYTPYRGPGPAGRR